MIELADLNRLLVEKFDSVRKEETNDEEITIWCRKNDIPEKTLIDLSNHMALSMRQEVVDCVVGKNMPSEDAFDHAIGTCAIAMFVLGYEAHKEYGNIT